MKKIFILIFTILMTVLSCNAQNISASKLYEQKVDSVFFIKTQSGTGSGIILSEDGTFVTCFHVVADANYIKVENKKGDTFNVTGYKYLDPVNDVAILTIKTSKKFTPFSTVDSGKLNVGDTIYTISNPIGLQFVFSSGMVNRFDDKDIQFSAPSSPGSSGGALMDSSGNLVGMITSQYDPSRAQNINFAVQNKFYLSHLNDKTKMNTKGLLWSDFVASRLNKKELKLFVKYAYNDSNYTMLYKYLPYYLPDEEVASDDYLLRGVYALDVFIDEMDNNNVLNDAAKWFALSILSNKNLEESAFGLFIVGLYNGDISLMTACHDTLKKYPKSYQKASEIAGRLLKLVEKDKKDKQELIDLYVDAYKYYMSIVKF